MTQTAESPKQRKYVDPCGCGACPRKPTNRPPTMQECIEIWTHKYGSAWPVERIREFAISDFAFTYAYGWVLWRGWRKPPNWREGQRVPLRLIRPQNAPLNRDRYERWARGLMNKHRIPEGGEHDV